MFRYHERVKTFLFCKTNLSKIKEHTHGQTDEKSNVKDIYVRPLKREKYFLKNSYDDHKTD